MGPLIRFSLSQIAGRRRLALIIGLCALPVGLAAFLSVFASPGFSYHRGLVNGLVDGVVIAVILPLVTMTLATTAFGNELEDRTLGYLALTPAPRWWIVLSKFAAGFLVAGPLLVVSGVVATLIGLDGDLRAASAVGVSLLIGTLAYTAIFIWAGLIASRALSFALVYVFLWEGVLSTFLGGVRYLSVRGYTLSIVHGIDGDVFRSLGPRVIEFPAALVGAGAVTVLFVWLTVRRLRRMDIP
jgi:ABC-2 type transport system permease protein